MARPFFLSFREPPFPKPTLNKGVEGVNRPKPETLFEIDLVIRVGDQTVRFFCPPPVPISSLTGHNWGGLPQQRLPIGSLEPCHGPIS